MGSTFATIATGLLLPTELTSCWHYPEMPICAKLMPSQWHSEYTFSTELGAIHIPRGMSLVFTQWSSYSILRAAGPDESWGTLVTTEPEAWVVFRACQGALPFQAHLHFPCTQPLCPEGSHTSHSRKGLGHWGMCRSHTATPSQEGRERPAGTWPRGHHPWMWLWLARMVFPPVHCCGPWCSGTSTF